VRLAVAHQFDDAFQQHEAAGLGMWTFLASEVMIFGALFVGYSVYRAGAPEAFAHASGHLYESIGAANTAILLTSSVTMALAVRAADTGRRGRTTRLIVATALLGCAFLGLKSIEYWLDYSDRLLPGVNFGPDKGGPHVELFLAFYWIVTALHALHLTAGIIATLAIASLIRSDGSVTQRSNQVEVVGLYWHFVDIVWIFLFPMLYLVR
jgi:cytochrome c oxidase subunit III